MILHVDPRAPWYIHAAADAALAGHIGGGTAGIAAGFVAAAARKGERAHRVAGNVFFVAMLVAYGVGAVVSPLIHQPANALGGAFGCYLVATAWATVRRPPGQVGHFEIGATALIAAAAVVMAALALVGAREPSLLGGVPWPVFAVVSGLSAAAAWRDLSLVLAGGISGTPRIARHLWRMCLAFFFGTGSLFLGQPKVFPPSLRGSPLLIALAVAPLVIMAFWLVRIRSRGRARPPAAISPAQEALT